VLYVRIGSIASRVLDIQVALMHEVCRVDPLHCVRILFLVSSLLRLRVSFLRSSFVVPSVPEEEYAALPQEGSGNQTMASASHVCGGSGCRRNL
jgi:hypothetical protein